MGDAARQLPDRFHLLRLSQVVFQPSALGDVTTDGVHGNGDAVPALDPARQLENDAPAFLRQDRDFIVRVRRVLRVLEQPFGLAAQLRRDEIEDVFADELVPRIAGQLRPARFTLWMRPSRPRV